MVESYFIKGMLMGIVFGVPAGAIGVLTIRNTLDTGFFAGFFTGLGSSAADFLYAIVCVFGLTMLSDIMLRWQTPLGILGGAVIIGLGLATFAHYKAPDSSLNPRLRVAGHFTASFVIAIMNPATILSFFVAFAAFGISGNMSPQKGTALIAGITLGTCCWWAGLSGVVSAFRTRITAKIYPVLNRILGCSLVLLGLVLLVDTSL